MAELGAFDDMKVELDWGQIIRMTPPNAPHGAVVARVIVALAAALRETDYTVTGEAAVVLPNDSVFAFDAAVTSGSLPDGPYRPDGLHLAVEVAATSLDRDLGRKAAAYAEAGIAVYWVVDVNARVTHVMSVPGDGRYAAREVVRFGEPLTLPQGLGTIVLD
jgi:Uma2 family endonuclease